MKIARNDSPGSLNKPVQALRLHEPKLYMAPTLLVRTSIKGDNKRSLPTRAETANGTKRSLPTRAETANGTKRSLFARA
ncbi:hypothetical protein ACFX1T_037858 [Malus domestica]